MDRYDWILEQINNLDVQDLVDLHNEYCEYNNDMDSYIYDIGMIDELLNGSSATDILEQIDFDSFKLTDSYLQYTIYGFHTTNYPLEDDWIFPEDIARSIDEGNFEPSDSIDLAGFNEQLIDKLEELSNDELIKLILSVEGYEQPYYDESTNTWYDSDNDEPIDDNEYEIYIDDLESLVNDYGEEIMEYFG